MSPRSTTRLAAARAAATCRVAALLVLAGLVAPGAPASPQRRDESEPRRSERQTAAALVALEEQAQMTELLLEQALEAHATAAGARDAARQALDNATRQLETLLERPEELTADLLDQAARRADAARSLWQARDEVARLRLEDARRLVERRDALLVRVASLRGDLPDRREVLTGLWEVRWMPAGVTGTFEFEQEGALVTGQYRLRQQGSGSLQGTFVSGKLRLTRIDRQKGRDLELEGWIDGSGEVIRGTWQAFELAQGGLPHGQWIARRVD